MLVNKETKTTGFEFSDRNDKSQNNVESNGCQLHVFLLSVCALCSLDHNFPINFLPFLHFSILLDLFTPKIFSPQINTSYIL